MEFVELTEKEFRKFEQKHEIGNFYQTVEWGKLKEKNGWKYYFLGVKENKKIIGAALILKKNVLSKLSILYSPRGFLINYNNTKLLKFFTSNIRKFAKKHNAIFVKIDPCLIYKQRDINGEVVSSGIDNSKVVDELKKLGYKHNGFTESGDLQPRYVFALNYKIFDKKELFESFESTTKKMIRKNEKLGIKTRDIDISELDKFKVIMDDTAKRRGFIDRPFEYYQNMINILGDSVKIKLAEINLNEYIDRLEEEKENFEKQKKAREEEISSGKEVSNRKMNNRLEEIRISINSINKKIEKSEKLKNEYGDVLVLGGILFMLHNDEVLSLFGGANSNYRDFMPAYTLNWDMNFELIDKGYKRYNFYGISNFKDKNNEMYGLYDFKRGYGGCVEEYIGEFNLIISKFWYFMYTVMYNKVYLRIKSIKLKKSSKQS